MYKNTLLAKFNINTIINTVKNNVKITVGEPEIPFISWNNNKNDPARQKTTILFSFLDLFTILTLIFI
jgi:hypothetical protein